MAQDINTTKPNKARRTAHPSDACVAAACGAREVVGILEEVKAVSLETPALHDVETAPPL